jgi:hypothetical protein
MMADYNGWADQREEEREALDQLETHPGLESRTLLIQRDEHKALTSSDLPPLRELVSPCWWNPAIDHVRLGVLHSLSCRSLSLCGLLLHSMQSTRRPTPASP